MSISVRHADSSDLDDIVRLWIELMEYHARLDPRFAIRDRAAASFRDFAGRLIAGPDSTVFCACVGGEIVGYVSVAIQQAAPVLTFERFGMIQDEVVAPEHRRSGVGTKLFEAARRWCRRRGVRIIQLMVAPQNSAAVGFWKKMGFQPYLERFWYDAD
jgi:ribosomal protein S18 acetylase RimI-like enzyme